MLNFVKYLVWPDPQYFKVINNAGAIRSIHNKHKNKYKHKYKHLGFPLTLRAWLKLNLKQKVNFIVLI